MIKNIKINLLLFILIFSFIALGCSRVQRLVPGSSNSSETQHDPASYKDTTMPAGTKPITINLTALLDEYSDKESEADKKYKDKWMTISGKVLDVNYIQPINKTSVTLGDGLHDKFAAVDCFFEASERDSVSDLKKRSVITVTGKNEGWSGIYAVHFSSCKLQ
jgi:hypothetical protein